MSVLAAIRGLVRSDEDLATLAIGHVLQQSSRAQQGINDLLAVDGDTAWTTQDVQEDEGDGRPRPDLAGYVGSSATAFVEAKFDAGLTRNQPVGYIERLAEDGHLAMLVPQARVRYVTHECLRRIDQAGWAREPIDGGWAVDLGERGRRRFSVTTWDVLVRQLLDATRQPDARAAHDDLVQVRDLVEDVQERLFTPLTGEELTDGQLPRQMLQLLSLFAELRARLDGGVWVRYGQHGAHQSGDQSFQFWRKGSKLKWWAFFGLGAWRDLAPTPFWLGLHWEQRAEYDHLLRPLLDGAPPSGYEMPTWNHPGVAIPLQVEPGLDRDALLVSLVEQIDYWTRWAEDRLQD